MLVTHELNLIKNFKFNSPTVTTNIIHHTWNTKILMLPQFTYQYLFLPIELKISHFSILKWFTIIGEFYLRSFSLLPLDVVLTKSLVRGLVKESAKFPHDLTNEIEMIPS